MYYVFKVDSSRSESPVGCRPFCCSLFECVMFQVPESPNLDLSDDEELSQQFDMHSLIVSSLQAHDADHVATADEVISEIETMMQVMFIRMLTCEC